MKKKINICLVGIFSLLLLVLRYGSMTERISGKFEADCVFALFFVLLLIMAVKNPGDIFKPDLHCGIFSALISFSMIATPYLGGYKTALFSGYEEYLLFLFYLCFFYLLFVGTKKLWLQDASNSLCEGRAAKPDWKEAVFLALFFGFLLVIQYKVYFPYGITPDNCNQWAQLHGELNYNKIHAIGHTIFLKGLLSIYDNYITVIIFHLLCVVAIYLCFAFWFRRKGMPLPSVMLVFGVTLATFSSASVAFFYPWKDTPAAVCICVVTLILLKYHDEGALSLPSAAVLGFALAWCWLFRLNGIIALFVCGIYFAVSFIRRKYYRQLALMLAAIALSSSFVNIYSEKVLKSADYENGFSIQPFLYGIAAMVNSGELSEAELEEVDALVSVEWMEDNYSLFKTRTDLIWKDDDDPRITADPNMKIFNNGFVLDAGEHKAELVLLYLKLMPKHFLVCAEDVLASLFMMWRCERLFMGSYLFQFLMIVFIAIKARLKLKDSIIFLPSLCNTVSIMISTCTNETRYLLPAFMLMPVFFLYIVWKNSEYKKIK